MFLNFLFYRKPLVRKISFLYFIPMGEGLHKNAVIYCEKFLFFTAEKIGGKNFSKFSREFGRA